MKPLIYVIALMVLTSCTHQPKSSSNTGKTKTGNYTDQQLEAFLDSIGHLPTGPFADKVAQYTDSAFRSPVSMDTVISVKDMDILKHAIRKGYIAVKTARRIFNDKEIDSTCTTKSIFLTYKKGLTPIELVPFDKTKSDFNEYAIYIGDPGQCYNAYLYFFKGNRIISKHNGYNRFGSELEHYKDDDGKTVVYYGYNFTEGSGVDWVNYFFYKYDHCKLIPILNELETGDLQGSWRGRSVWLDAIVLKTNPLTIKMVYNQYFSKSNPDSVYKSNPEFINDSTVVTYSWDEQSKTLKGNYSQSKISRAQVLSYYLAYSEHLFMNAYYSLLKQTLKDKKLRPWTLNYLNEVKKDNLQ